MPRRAEHRPSSRRHDSRRYRAAIVALVAAVAFTGAVTLLARSGALPRTASPRYSSILVAADTDAGDGFGSSVALDGERIAVGAFRDGDAAERAGAAYVLVRDGVGWRELAKLQAPDALTGDQAGFSIALEERWLAVGAVGSFGKWADGSRTEGAVHLFEALDSGWSFARTLRVPSGQPDDRFGFTVAIDGQRLAVGARGVDADAGAVYLYDLSAPDTPLQRLDAPDRLPGDRFGEALAFADGLIVVGAPGKDGVGTNAGYEDVGGVYAFAVNEQHAPPGAAITVIESPEPLARAQFGVGVATDGNRILVGASHWRRTDAGGSAWLVSADSTGNGWSLPVRLSTGAVDAGAMPGFRVALDGERAVVGAHLDSLGASDAGAVLVYQLPAADIAAGVAVWRLAADDADAHDVFGIALALDGQMLAVGAEAADAAGKNSGGLYVIALP